jgi:molybdate transport system regulatory protein
MPTPTTQLRVFFGPDTWMGPGKADLLQLIEETGSIAAAGRRMGMSYKRAWYLIDSLNAIFAEPVVSSSRGGKAGGGAHLTETGRRVLDLYRRMQARAERSIAAEAAELGALMRAVDAARERL